MTEADAGRIVFESEADRAGFVQFPNVVLMDESLSSRARLLYGLLLHYARQDGACYPGQELLGRKLGVCDRSVRRYIVELEEALLVRCDQRGTARSCLYVILALAGYVEQRRTRLSDGHQRPAHDGHQRPAEVDAEEQDSGSRERARGKLRIRGKPVKAETWERTVAALDEFNRQARKSLAAITGTGEPSEAAKRIYGRLAAWPDLTAEQVADTIRRTLESRWWGSDPPTVGVVFGPRVFEENLSRSGTPAGEGGRGEGRPRRPRQFGFERSDFRHLDEGIQS